MSNMKMGSPKRSFPPPDNIGPGTTNDIAFDSQYTMRVYGLDSAFDKLNSILENQFIRIRPLIASRVVESETSPQGEEQLKEAAGPYDGSQSSVEQELIRLQQRADRFEERLRYVLENLVV
jgi:hypothetical protein